MAKKASSSKRTPSRARSVPVRGELLRAQRLALALAQNDLACKAGLSARLIRKAEDGGPVQMQSLAALAEALQLPQYALIAMDQVATRQRSDIARRAVEFLEQIWNHGNLSVIDTHLLPTFRFHHERGVVSNRAEMRQRIIEFRRSFDQFDFVVDDVVDHGGFVVCRWHVAMTHTGPWLDLEPTGLRNTVYGASWVHVVDGKFGDAWDFWDPALLYQQLAGSTVDRTDERMSSSG